MHIHIYITSAALEHGGTATAIVDRDVDLNTVVPSIVKGAFYHAGQVQGGGGSKIGKFMKKKNPNQLFWLTTHKG